MRDYYEYDALGNRMRILANYTGINGETTPYTQDFWYDYDSRNRMIIAKGSLDASQGVVHGSTGYRLYYNMVGQRSQVIYQSYNEQYQYTADNRLQRVYIDSGNGPVLRAERFYDNIGNMTSYKEYKEDGSVQSNRTYTYNKDHQIIQDNDALTSKGYNNVYDAVGNIQSSTTYGPGETSVTTSYTYALWDSYKQSEIKNQATWAPGLSRYTYDVNGHVIQVTDVAGDRRLDYTSTQSGMILRREEYEFGGRVGQQYFYYIITAWSGMWVTPGLRIAIMPSP